MASNSTRYKSFKAPGIDINFCTDKPSQFQIHVDAAKYLAKKWNEINEPHECNLLHVFPPSKPASECNGVPLLPDFRNFKLTRRILACLLPHLIKLTCDREKPEWGDQRKRPVWWPKRTPFLNPATGGWYKGTVSRNRAEQNNPLFEIIEACYEYYGQYERFGVNNFNSDGWTILTGGDELPQF